ncbi:MAG: hypothetical protein GY906_27825 [bacterium]|nr:hypothetical protein [bacterium]
MQYDDQKFLVIPVKDLAYLTQAQRASLGEPLAAIMTGRTRDGLPASNKYYIVNQDEPYAGQILHEILIAEEKKASMVMQGLWPKPRRRKTDI